MEKFNLVLKVVNIIAITAALLMGFNFLYQGDYAHANSFFIIGSFGILYNKLDSKKGR